MKKLKIRGLIKALAYCLFCVSLIAIDYYCFGGSHIVYATLLGTVPASSTGEFNLTYVPQYLMVERPAGAAQCSQVRVNVLGVEGVIWDMSGVATLNTMGGIRRPGQAGALFQLFPLANGKINRGTVVINVTNADAVNTMDVHDFSLQPGSNFFKGVNQKIFQSSGVDFYDFTYLALNDLGAPDEINITFRNGHTQRFTQLELQTMLTLYTDWVGAIGVDNLDLIVRKVQIIPAGDRTIGKLSVMQAGSASESNQLANN